jgi:hypothetical protein
VQVNVLSKSVQIKSVKMLRDVIIKFFIFACNINEKLVKAHYFSKLKRDDASNYALFDKFASECSNSLLCLLHSLGYCNGDVTLENIIRRHVETRRSTKGFYENDVGGVIAAFLHQPENREQRQGKSMQI